MVMPDRGRAVLILMAIWGLTAGAASAGGRIVGAISIQKEQGLNVYGERLAVFLVTSPNPVSAEACEQEFHPQRRVDCLNNRHLDFYKRFQEKRRLKDYLVAQTDTSATGNFAFFDVPPGDYYLLVTFPSMIDGYKVAWQAPVTVGTAGFCVAILNEDNLVLPKHRRR